MANTTIRDPELLPFFITKDPYCYTVMEIITPDEKNVGKFKKKNNGNEGKDYEKVVGHYTSLAAALKKIAKGKTDHQKEYSSIMSYIGEYTKEKEVMENLLNKLGV